MRLVAHARSASSRNAERGTRNAAEIEDPVRKAKPIAVLALVLIVGTSLRYGLPRQTVVRIVGVKERLETLGWNRVFYSTAPSGQTEGDVRMIETIRP